ncbi:MAG TPA: 30S ribosomal protein S6 [bacterium]|nr:30S ribosomal protein S6 [bacterium]
MTRSYEVMVYLKAVLTDEEVAAILGRVKGYLTEAGAQIEEEKPPEKKRLPYIIKKNRDGIYCYFKASIPAEAVAGLRDRIRLTEEIIRFMISVVVPFKPVKKKKSKKKAAAEAAAAQPQAGPAEAAEPAAAEPETEKAPAEPES